MKPRLTPQQKASLMVVDPQVAQLKQWEEIDDLKNTFSSNIEVLNKSLKLQEEQNALMKMMTGKKPVQLYGVVKMKGTAGKTPVKGIDYMTPDEIELIKKDLSPVKGRDYFDGKSINKDEVVKEVVPLVINSIPSKEDVAQIVLGMLPPPQKIDVQDIVGRVSKSLPKSKAFDREGLIVETLNRVPKTEPFKIDLLTEINKFNREVDWKVLKNIPYDILHGTNGKGKEQKHGGGSGSKWTPLGVTTITVGGILAGTDLGTTPVDIGTTLIEMLYPGSNPAIVLTASIAGGAREIGDTASLAAVTFTATTTEGANPITSVEFYRDASLIYTVPTPNPTGGVETDPNPETITTNTSFTAKISDGVVPTITSNTVSYSFVSAYYYGSANAGLDISADGGGLTKLVVGDSPTISFVYNPTFPQVYYMAYPDSYPALTSIKDNSNFETISDWVVSTVSVTNSFGSTVNYRQYEFKNPTTQTSFTNTFIQ